MEPMAPIVTPLAAFKRLHRSARSALDRTLAPNGLSAARMTVLRLLTEEEGLTGAELARRAWVSPPTMNETVRWLLRQEMITRRPDPRGGRAIQLFIAPAGQAALDRAFPLLLELAEHLVAGIEPERLRSFFDTLDEIAERADAYGKP
jgi:DNA-binding MarR family transcriptional regulator